MPRSIEPERWQKYRTCRKMNMSVTAAAREAKISRSAALAFEKGLPNSSGAMWQRARDDLDLLDVIPLDSLSPAAREALDDFGLFRRRYFGRIPSPWQERAAAQMLEWLDSPDKEFVVVNCPPGSGKSTLFTHDLPAWLACRNRSLRCMIGSRTEQQARMYTARLRRTFDRRLPVVADPDDVSKGWALDAEATLVADFGRFRPEQQDLWRIGEFVIAQHGSAQLEDKEPSFAAFGMDSGFLGGRYDLVVWDDLVDRRTMRSAEGREQLQTWFESEAETRVEPGGLFVLQGQRMGGGDLYRYALDMRAGDMDEDEEIEAAVAGDDRPAKYRHIVFQAHDDTKCGGKATHARKAPAWPDGCLLDPVRLPWRELATIRRNRAERFEVLYQQRDVDLASTLVQPLWVSGGTDPATGETFPGCWDVRRDIGELPEGVEGPVLSVASTDPSPTKMWAHEWWCYTPDTFDLRFLMDLHRAAMAVTDVLTWDPISKQWSGLMESWWQASKEMGHPITHWVFEWNAAQRFFTESAEFRRWAQLRHVQVIAHTTGRNKADPEYGVQMLSPLWRFGKVRLPGRPDTQARVKSMHLVDEVTRWAPDGTGGGTDDCVMSQWQFENRLIHMQPSRHPLRKQQRPSWMLEPA